MAFEEWFFTFNLIFQAIFKMTVNHSLKIISFLWIYKVLYQDVLAESHYIWQPEYVQISFCLPFKKKITSNMNIILKCHWLCYICGLFCWQYEHEVWTLMPSDNAIPTFCHREAVSNWRRQFGELSIAWTIWITLNKRLDHLSIFEMIFLSWSSNGLDWSQQSDWSMMPTGIHPPTSYSDQH